MFGLKKSGNSGTVKAEKLPGPRETPQIVQKYLVNDMHFDTELAHVLKAVIRRKNGTEQKSKSFDIRIFDEGDALANKVDIKDYLVLAQYPNLIIFEGWYDESTGQVVLEEKNRISQETTIFTEEEILQKIEALNEPGNSIFFFMARGPACGGPLGRGAAIVQRTAPVDGKKVKKYTIFTADVVNMKPATKLNRLYDSDKAKDIAKWVKESHHKRIF
jgi:hypothetical protein